jgi:hypothetical protein
MFVLRAEIVTIFVSKMVTISARNTFKHIQKMQTSQGYIFQALQHFVTNFAILLILITSLREFTFFCLESKISLTEEFPTDELKELHSWVYKSSGFLVHCFPPLCWIIISTFTIFS